MNFSQWNRMWFKDPIPKFYSTDLTRKNKSYTWIKYQANSQEN